MSPELPVLRIGHAGFSLEQLEQLRAAVATELATGLSWEFHPFADADALLVNGARAHPLADGTLRIAPGMPAARYVQVALDELQRPIAFAVPAGLQAPAQAQALAVFDPASAPSVHAVLRGFARELSPLVAQFCLASQILQQDSALGSGTYRVKSPDGELLAVVDLRGDVGVLPGASPLDIDAASWKLQPRHAPTELPSNLMRCSLSELMWAYALRTTHETLPGRYRAGLIYFRRPPRLPQRLLRDSHLLLLRELADVPASFVQLQQRTGLSEGDLAQDLGALYLVGAITANPRRASSAVPRRDSMAAELPFTQRDSGPDHLRPSDGFGRTAPVPLTF